MSDVLLTPSQTTGPFFHHGLLHANATRNVLTTAETVGQRIRIEGHVYDGDHVGVPDAIIEIWQADSEGHYYYPASRERKRPEDMNAFLGYGRSGTDANGAYWFETIKPGKVPFDGERMQAPHICIAVFGRGLLNHLLTRLYFAGEPENADDPALRCVPLERRERLLGRREGSGADIIVYRFDIVLQGPGETVFFR
ncbi:MAG TPA: protocatechuate 3,4-dioxygenase subunit alpha [Gemmataceae bacterium]|nr:protocatechuate 3,4-dioxygenase subunit alpha [Gemmataceae bacterium]